MDPNRRTAAAVRALHAALVAEGFTDDQAVVLLCPLIANQASTQPRRPAGDRARLLESLLSGDKPPATRSPADDRAADLWNPPAPDTGAPAHE